MDAIVGIAFSCGPHVSSRKPAGKVGETFVREGASERRRREECYYVELVRKSWICAERGWSMGIFGREMPALDTWDDLGWFLPGSVPDGGVRNTACELAIPSMPSAISKSIVHAALA